MELCDADAARENEAIFMQASRDNNAVALGHGVVVERC
jgi:hypothetical protein